MKTIFLEETNLSPELQITDFGFDNLVKVGCVPIKVQIKKKEFDGKPNVEFDGMINNSPNLIVTEKGVVLARTNQILIKTTEGNYKVATLKEIVRFSVAWPDNRPICTIELDELNDLEFNSLETALSNQSDPEIQKVTVGDYPTFYLPVKRKVITRMDEGTAIIPSTFLKGAAFFGIEMLRVPA